MIITNGEKGDKGEKGEKGETGQSSYEVATQEQDGLMSKEDKTKLDTLENTKIIQEEGEATTENVYSAEAVDSKFANIIESGNNENGEWIKFSDGTMICTKTISGTCTTIPWGAIYYCDIEWTNWAKTFATIQAVSANSISEVYWCSTNYNTYGTYTRLFRPTEATDPYSVCLTAIGRWK